MKFGFFDDAKREYVINTPETPYPWINYFGNENFFGLMSNTSGGYCFYRDARLRRLTRYRYNSIPVDNGGRYFYINDGGDIWTPGWMPVRKELEFYECRHGLGYTRITGEKNGISASQLSFIPLGFNGEVHKLTIKNKTAEKRHIKLFSFVEWCLWNAYDDMTNFQRNFSTGEVEVDGPCIYHKTEYRERRNHYAFYWSNTPVDGFDTDRESFIGLYNGLDSPKAVVEGHSKNSIASGWQPVASHFFNMALDSGEEKSIIFILGYVENPEGEKWEGLNVINKKPAIKMQNQFSTETQVDAALDELKTYWEGLLSAFSIQSSDEKLNRMVNIWNPYQCMVTFNMSRSASYFESGIGRGMGFRDSNQDLLGFVHQIPQRARQRILDIAATQFEDGGCYHQYQPLTRKGNNDIGGGFNDDPLWLILGTTAYIKETGDFGILDENVPFDGNSKAAPLPNPDAVKAPTLLDHLRRSFSHVTDNLGPHGLPLIGRADWNDCLNLNCFSVTPDESFQTYGDPDGRVAESIFIAGLFVYVGQEYVGLLRQRGLVEEADKARSLIQDMKQTVYKYGYDGEWFLRAYDAFGQKIGSKENAEAQIFIEPQGMCVMAGLGCENGLAEKALNSVKERLECEYGIVLNNPPYSRYDKNIGEITSYPPGYKENAGIFCHNNPWIMCAETMIGRGNRAFELYKKITPSYIEDISDIHRTEPYVYSQMIAGKDAVRPGEAKNSWLSGTAAWTFTAITQWILGIQPDFAGLKINPCIPSDWSGYTIKRRFRGTTYIIDILNPSRVEKGIKSITADGKPIDGNIIPAFNDGLEHRVNVLMG